MHSTRRIMNRLSDEFLFLSGYLRSFRNQVAVEMLEPIDIVVTWVDGNDPAWLKEKNKYETCHNHFLHMVTASVDIVIGKSLAIGFVLLNSMLHGSIKFFS